MTLYDTPTAAGSDPYSESTSFGFNDVNAARSKRRNILLNCGVLPHLRVHCGADNDWRTRCDQHIGH